jgi:hypothetical protein
MSNWSVGEFLTGKFPNNFGSYCNLITKDVNITGEYFIKPSRGKLI